MKMSINLRKRQEKEKWQNLWKNWFYLFGVTQKLINAYFRNVHQIFIIAFSLNGNN